MGRRVKISTDGGVTLPKATRERLGWKPGEELVVRSIDDGIVIEKTPVAKPKKSARNQP